MRSTKLGSFVANQAPVQCVQVGPKYGQVLVSGDADGFINLWRIDKPTSWFTCGDGATPFESVCFDPTESTVVAGAQTGSLNLFSLGSEGIVQTATLKGHRSSCTALDFHPYGDFIVSGSLDTNIKIWDIRTKACVRTYKSHTERVNCVQFSPDGKWVASGGDDGHVKIWDLIKGKLLEEFTTHDGPVNNVKFHPNELLLASGSSDRTVKFWDLESSKNVGTTPVDTAKVARLAFLEGEQDGKGSVVAVSSSGAKSWEWEPCRCTSSAKVDFGRIGDVFVTEAGSPNANEAIVCGFKKSVVSLWRCSMDSDAFDTDYRASPRVESKHGDVVIKVSARDEQRSRQHRAQSSARETTRTPGQTKKPSSDLRSRQIEPRESARLRPERRSANSRHVSQQHAHNTPERSSGTRNGRTPVCAVTKPATRSKTASSAARNTDEEKKPERPYSTPSTQGMPQSLPLTRPMRSESPPRTHVREQKENHCDSSNSVAESDDTVRQKDGRRSTPDDNASTPSIVPANHKSPLGLSYSQFMPKPATSYELNEPVSQQPKNSTEHRIEVAKKLLVGHEKFSTVIGARLVVLKQMKSLWQLGNVKAVIRFLQQQQDNSVTVDFLKYANLRGAGIDLDCCISMLPLIGEILESAYECYLQVGLTTLADLAESFSGMLHSARALENGQDRRDVGVNVAQDERNKRCTACFAAFQLLMPKLDAIVHSKRDTSVSAENATLGPIIRQASRLLETLQGI